jgi:AAA+ ATPase superfamily predicted ATPase
VTALLQDSQGNLWAGTANGPLRFDGQEWMNILPGISVTILTEGPPGVVWVGGLQGLIQYNLETEEQTRFDSANSGLATNWVRDLYVDQAEGLWVSTYAINRTSRSPWWAVGVGFLFFGYLFVNTYRGYVQTPETRARRLGRQIIAEPHKLYPDIYTLLANDTDAPAVLSRLAGYISDAGDQTGAEATSALAALASNSPVDHALGETVVALKADSARMWAEALHRLHSLLAVVLASRRVPEIADLELTANPGKRSGEISLRVGNQSIETLPPFLSQGTAEAWRALERVCLALHKYQEVDAATDRLSYLAEALSATEAAQTATHALGPPEGIVMTKMTDQWRAAVTNEINEVSGRADLRLELRTRQMHRAAQVTLSLQLQNDGRAAAENVSVTLQPGPSSSVAGETRLEFERIPSGRAMPIELSIAPTEAEDTRIVCRVTWDDRLAEGNSIEFADVVHFYEVAEEFRRISNPYIVGHPVKSAKMFQGREDTIRYIQDNLSGSVQDRTLVLHGQRRTGKTSILYQLLQGRLGQSFIPVLVDMQELALLVNSTGDFLAELAYQLARTARKAGVDIEEPTPDDFTASSTRVFNRFVDKLEDSLNGRRVVVMFDEFELIEDKIVEGKLDANLLGYFRSLVQHRDGLTFIFTGTHRLEEMSHDYWSILFNIALYRRVSFLTPADAVRLIRQPVAGSLDVDDLAVEKIINLTGGHPYFIQLICWAMVNHCNAQERNYATINDVNDVVQEILMSGEAYFAYIWQQASTLDRLALAGLAHTLQPGKAWARPAEILATLVDGGDTQTQRTVLVDALDRLVTREVLEVAREGTLRYRFQIEVLRLWVQATKSIAALVERRQ